MVRAIVGANWGDEGKGKLTDSFSEHSDIVIRFQGGANAGHTIINAYGRFSLHMLPSGVFNRHVTNIIGNGVALDVEKLCKEVAALQEQGVPAPKLLVSDRAQIMMPYHVLLDIYEEERLKGEGFGSTKSGIAPFYSDKYAKIGFQVSDLFAEENKLYDKLKKILEVKNILMEAVYKKPTLQVDVIFAQLLKYKTMLEPYVADTFTFIQQSVKAGKHILLEGQLGALKDPDFGIYPFTTSSSTLASFASIGAGVPHLAIREIVAVTKAYSSAVGAGAFVSEIFGEEAEELRKRGGDQGEYGATTGRPRRMGWYDAVASRFGCQAQGATHAALTVVDALSYLDEIPVCVAYRIDGQETTVFPVTSKLNEAEPVYRVLPGWKTDIRGIKRYEDLPETCRAYIEFIEEQIETPVAIISNGPKREDIIYRNKEFALR